MMPARGIGDLRTLAGRSDGKVASYKTYLQVSFLELERARHELEIAKVQRRLEFMVARCLEIDAEKTKLLDGSGVPPQPKHSEPSPIGRPNKPAKREFRFAY
jgi:hypothetical protein